MVSRVQSKRCSCCGEVIVIDLIYLFVYSYSEFCPCFFASLTGFVLLFFFFFAFRSWLHSACYQCDPAEGLWGWGDSWGKWWKVQSRLHQHRAPRLPQVPTPRSPPLLWRRLTWLMDVSEMFRVVWRHFHVIVCVFFLQGTEGQEEQSVGSHAAQQLSSPGRCAMLDHHQPQPAGPWQEEDLPTVVSTTQDNVEIANWWHWSILKWSPSV